MTTETHMHRNAAQEASDLVGPAWQARVLEPSPPAIHDGDWFADDPVATVEGVPALLPRGLATDATDWNSWLANNGAHAEWIAQRWLGGNRSLPAAPQTLTDTRLALHRLAAYVIAPVRHAANGKFGLRWTLGGFGTPFFGEDRQIRVEGTTLVDQRGDAVRSAAITTLADAAAFLETEIDTETAAEHDSPPVGELDEALTIDPAAAAFLGEWFGMAFATLECVRASAGSVDPSRPQIWPGHFDPAIEVGDDDHRGSYGASPGDHTIDEPYLYVSLWWPDRLSIDADDPIWNAPSFTGAVLRLSDFDSGDPVDVATNFFLTIRDRVEQ